MHMTMEISTLNQYIDRITVLIPLSFRKKSNDRTEQTAAPATVTSNYRRRLFKPIINSAEPGVKIPRSGCKSIYNSKVENNMINEVLVKTKDLVWCFLRLEASAHNLNQTVPGCNGFCNYI